MKFGKSLLLVLCLALTFLTSACTTRSPAVDLFETFKGHISNKKYDAAYNMLAETGRPATVDEFRKGM
ncbi:MAG: hypothetical protein KDB07_13870, partial [Planctomycetes bacterium]|nr:hypothetical protein [Planctomycetota bacterium]